MPFPASYPPVTNALTTTQRFSRRAVGFLWSKRSELDPGQVSILNSLYNNRKKGSVECQQTITYKLSRSKAGLLGYGRYYGSKGSLETLEKECRGTICGEFYHDIDIKNCHPVLLSQFARNYYEKDLPENDYYVSNRDKVLNAIGGSRDEAKEQLIRILYGGINKHPITAKLSEEVRSFSKFLSQRPEHANLFAAVKHEKNVYGSFLSYLLQTEERRCMLAIRDSLEQDGWSVDVLAYDGVMVRKREGPYSIHEAMRKAEGVVRDATGYDIELADKEFSRFELPPLQETLCEGVSEADYDRLKQKFEENHFYFVPQDTVVEIQDDGILFVIPNPRHYLQNSWSFTQKNWLQSTPFYDIWMKDPKRRDVFKIDMKPSEDPKVFSPPLRWAWANTEASDDPLPYLTLFHLLLQKLIPDAELRTFTLQWLGHLLQTPFQNPKCGIILTGGMGCGKDTLGDFLSEFVIGRHLCCNYDSNEQFWAPHDTGRMNKLFVKIEEVSGFLNSRNESSLKSRITAEYSTFNPKGLKEVEAPNYNRYFMTTNDPSPVRTSDKERRFVIIPCGSELIGKMEVWSEIRKVLFTPEGGRAIADYLMNEDNTEFPRRIAISNYARELCEEQKTSEERFLESWDGAECTTGELYDKYVFFCSENRLRSCGSANSFGRLLMKPVRDGVIKKIRVGAERIHGYSK